MYNIVMHPESPELTSLQGIKGIEESQEGKWTNSQWLRYRTTGMTPEDMDHFDNSTFKEHESKIYNGIMRDADLLVIARNKIRGIEALLEDDGIPNTETFYSLGMRTADLTTGINKLPKADINTILDAQYESLQELNTYGSTLWGMIREDSVDAVENKNAFSQSFEQSLALADNAEYDYALRVKFLRNAFWMANIFLDRSQEGRVGAVVNQWAQNSNLEALGAVFSTNDYVFNTAFWYHIKDTRSNQGLPYILVNYQRPPTKIIEEYNRHLVPPILIHMTDIVSRSNLDTVSSEQLDFVEGYLRYLRLDSTTLSLLREEGINFQELADNFFLGVYESVTEDYEKSSTSDLAWRRALRIFAHLYEHDESLSLDIPENLNRTWLVDILNAKSRRATQRCVFDLAEKLEIDLGDRQISEFK